MGPNIHLALCRQSQLTLPEVHQDVSDTLQLQSDETNVVLEQDSSVDLGHLSQLLKSCKWDDAIALIHHYHNDIAHHVMEVVCQGETYMVTPIHFAVGAIADCPIPVLEALVEAHPAALLMADAKRGLSPIHLGLIKGTISIGQINYLFSVCPELASHQDVDGDVPLHLAVKYASDEMIQRVLTVCPAAAGYQTQRQRYALHIYAASHCQIIDSRDSEAMSDASITSMKAIMDAYPKALQQPDLQGRLPIHLAACTPFPRWEVIKLLCDAYPESLLIQDENHKIPEQLLKRFSPSLSTCSTLDAQMSNPDNDVVLTFIHDRTNTEKRKKNSFHKLLSKVVPYKRKVSVSSLSHQKVVAVDLMNCYG
jgi:hypothetical protein